MCDHVTGALRAQSAGLAAGEPSPRLLLLAGGTLLSLMHRLLDESFLLTALPAGEAAPEVVRELAPDLVLVDALAPGVPERLMGGLRQAAGVPVLLVSPRQDEAVLDRLEGYADDYLLAPFTPRELLARVSGCLELARLRGELSRRDQALEASARLLEAARQGEERYRELVQHANSVIIRWSSDGTITFLNEYAQSFFGYRAEEIVGRQVSMLLPRLAEAGEVAELIRRILADPAAFRHNENENLCRDGRRVWMSWNNTPILDRQGGLVEILSVGSDISERKEAELALRRQHAKLEGINAILEAAVLCRSEAELGHACLEVAERVTQSSFGFFGEIKGDRLEIIAVSRPEGGADQGRQSGPFQIPLVIDRLITDGGGFFDGEALGEGGGGGHPPLDAFLGVPLMLGSSVTGIIAVANRPGGYSAAELEILDALAPAVVEAFQRKRAEQELRGSQTLLSLACVAAKAGAWEWDLETGRCAWSEELWKVYGLEPGSVPACYQTWRDMIHPDDLVRVEGVALDAIGEGKPVAVEWRLSRPDAPERWLLSRAEPKRDADGRLTSYVGIMFDITAQKRTEQELLLHRDHLEELVRERTAELEKRNAQLAVEVEEREKSELQFRQMAQTIDEVFWLASPYWREVFYISPAYERIWGRPCAELYSSPRRWMDAIVSEDLPHVLRHHRESAAGSDLEVEYRIIRPDGSLRWIRSRSYHLRDPAGESFVTGVAADITHRKRIEEVQRATVDLLRLCNQAEGLRELMLGLAAFFERFSGCERVRVRLRLRDADAFPYEEFCGDAEEFTPCPVGAGMEREGGGALCFCEEILAGRLPVAQPGGSEMESLCFRSRSELLAQAEAAGLRLPAAMNCVEDGYQTLAFLPLRSQGEVFGLLQFCDRRAGQLSSELLEALEPMVGYAAIALTKVMADEDLRRTSQDLLCAQDVGLIGSFIFDMCRDRWSSSPTLDRILGLDPGYPKNLAGWAQLIHPGQREETLGYVRELLAQRRNFDREYLVVRAGDGAQRWVHGKGAVEYQEDGTPWRMVGTIQDVTERKLAEEKIHRFTRRLLEVEEELRKRIANELHDDVGQELAALGLNLNFVARALPCGTSGTIIGRLEEARTLTKEIGRTVRSVMADLRPVQMDDYGLAASVRAHVELYSKRTGIEVEFHVDPLFPRQPAEKEIAVFRIVQEALTNVAKHAEAERVVVTLEGGVEKLRLTITDDGKGGAHQREGSEKGGFGWGIANMRERAELLGGGFRLSSPSGVGTTVEIEI